MDGKEINMEPPYGDKKHQENVNWLVSTVKDLISIVVEQNQKIKSTEKSFW
jgi:hypothetical protein